MLEFQIHWTQLLLVALARNALGMLWYSPLLFGPGWAAGMGTTQVEMRRRLWRVLPLEYAASVVLAFVLAQVLNFAGAIDWIMGVVVGLLMWLGFIAAATPNQVLYGTRPGRVWWVDAGFCLVSFIGMAVLLATWQWDAEIQAALAQARSRLPQ